MIDSKWRNVCTVVTSVLLMLFAMVQIILALALNLSSSQWKDKTDLSTVEEKTRLTTGINILIASLFVFPAAWTGICASVSRHRGVYIALAVMTSLALLGEIGAIVHLAWEFGNLQLFQANTSINEELAIALVVMTSIIILIVVALLIFAAIALHYGYVPKHHKPMGYRSQEHLVQDGPPQYYNGPIMPQSYPRTALSYAKGANTLADYRPLTRGSPEWDRFYDQYFANNRSYSADEYGRSKRRSSYRM